MASPGSTPRNADERGKDDIFSSRSAERCEGEIFSPRHLGGGGEDNNVFSYLDDRGSPTQHREPACHPGQAEGGPPQACGGDAWRAAAEGEGGSSSSAACGGHGMGPMMMGWEGSAAAGPPSKGDAKTHPPVFAVGGADAASRGVSDSRGGDHTQAPAPALGGADGSQVAAPDSVAVVDSVAVAGAGGGQVAAPDSECMDYVAEELVLLRGLRIKGAVDVGKLQPRVGDGLGLRGGGGGV